MDIHPTHANSLRTKTKLVIAKWLNMHCPDAKLRLATHLFGKSARQTRRRRNPTTNAIKINTNPHRSLPYQYSKPWHITVENAGSGIQLASFQVSPNQSMGALKALVKESCRGLILESSTPVFMNTDIDFADDSAFLWQAGIRDGIALTLVRAPGWTGQFRPFDVRGYHYFETKIHVSRDGEHFAVYTKTACKVYSFRDGQCVWSFSGRIGDDRDQDRIVLGIAFPGNNAARIIIHLCQPKPAGQYSFEVHNLSPVPTTEKHNFKSFPIANSFRTMRLTPDPEVILLFSRARHIFLLHNISTGAQRSVNLDPSPLELPDSWQRRPVCVCGDNITIFSQSDPRDKPTMWTFNYHTGKLVRHEILGKNHLPSLESDPKLFLRRAAWSPDGDRIMITCFRSFENLAIRPYSKPVTALGDVCVLREKAHRQKHTQLQQGRTQADSIRFGGPYLFGNVAAADLSPCGTLIAALTFDAFVEVYESETGRFLAREKLTSKFGSYPHIRILRRSPQIATVLAVTSDELDVKGIVLSNVAVCPCSLGGNDCYLPIKDQWCCSRMESFWHRRARFNSNARDHCCEKTCGPTWRLKLQYTFYSLLAVWVLLWIGGCVGHAMALTNDSGGDNVTNPITAAENTTAAIVTTIARADLQYNTDVVATAVQHHTTLRHLRGTMAEFLPIETA